MARPHRRCGARRFALAAGIGFAIGAATSADAQPSRANVAGESEVVVRANAGPALWRVTRGGSELVILGTVTPTPTTGLWNTRRMADALQGARLLLLSPGSTPGHAWAENFPASSRYFLGQQPGHTLDRELGDEDAARFERMAASIRQPWSAYSTYRPAPAGMRLLQDSWLARGFTGAKVDETVVNLARSQHVRVVKIDEGGELPLIDAMPSMSKSQHAVCVSEALDQFDREGVEAQVQFRAWADADLAGLQGYRPLRLCLDTMPGGAARRDQARAAWLKALQEALQTPGRTVAVMSVADLLEPSDLLAALRAAGGVVTAPRGAPGPDASPAADGSNRRLSLADPIQIADAAPPDLATLEVPGRLAKMKVELGSQRGRVGEIAQGERVCETDVAVGTLLARTTCHTRREWTDIEKQRSLDQVRALRDFSGRYHLPGSS